MAELNTMGLQVNPEQSREGSQRASASYGINYEDMLKAGMHYGRKRTVLNPSMNRYVFTVRDGICIIDLLKTQAQLMNSMEFLKRTINPPAGGVGLVLFVGITKQSSESMKSLAESFNMPYVIDRWLGGTLTNYKVINARVKKLEELENDMKTGALDKYTKKERLMLTRELVKMKVRFDGLKKLTRLPDAIFVSSLKESSLAVKEAKKMGIKVVGIANTDSNPEEIDYVIPANDRSKKSVDLIVDIITKELAE
ncbi:MAG: 30S ribosomal protein S2 [Candidatus Yanofskybacteria bacterium]|nr:30S ribosomal protein S2 [Candidatus Yanofskybacteria bacterium]